MLGGRVVALCRTESRRNSARPGFPADWRSVLVRAPMLCGPGCLLAGPHAAAANASRHREPAAAADERARESSEETGAQNARLHRRELTRPDRQQTRLIRHHRKKKKKNEC